MLHFSRDLFKDTLQHKAGCEPTTFQFLDLCATTVDLVPDLVK